jgi:hypothetical protein
MYLKTFKKGIIKLFKTYLIIIKKKKTINLNCEWLEEKKKKKKEY